MLHFYIDFTSLKNFSKDQGINKDQGDQAPKAKLPRGADTEIRIRIVAGIVVHVETVRVEVANVDGVAVGRLHRYVLFPP